MTTNGATNGAHHHDGTYSEEENETDHEDNSPEPDSDEMREEEFPNFFTERDNRLFHSHGSSPYPFPVDTPECDRLREQSRALRRFFGRNYVGPVREILETGTNGTGKRVLDYGTGKGGWLLRMAEEFPAVSFIGLDIVPIATRHPPTNVRFDVLDTDQVFIGQYPADNFDVVHARFVLQTTTDFSALINEFGRILRPGGLLISGEWGGMELHPPGISNPVTSTIESPLAPPAGIAQFFEIIHGAYQSLAIGTFPPLNISGSEFFNPEQTTSRSTPIPIGPVGSHMRRVWERFPQTIRPMLILLGRTDGELDSLFKDYADALNNTTGLVSVYHVVTARKRV